MTNTSANELVSSLIREYYKKNVHLAPDKIEQREFGFGTFEEKIRYRHFSFKNEKDLSDYLVKEAPPYVSYSSAYYRDPAGRPMESKHWLGSELVFDLDASDMRIPCQITHGRAWICKNCLKAVREEAIKLIEEFLIPDFGFSRQEIEVNFSGNRGYHVHIKRDSLLHLDANARGEISDYISGNGIDFDKLFPTSGQRGMRLVGPKPTDKGWQGKIAKNFLSNLNNGVESLEKLGIDRKTANILYKKRALIEMGIKNGNWDMVYIKNKADFWKSILGNQSIMQSDKIDKNVTKDPAHLIRLPNTINSEGGLIAKRMTINDLNFFNPMRDAIAFYGKELRVRADTPYEIEMNNETFGPYNNKEVSLPVYAAVYLYLKGLATIINA